jgi:hypothetical protein
VHPALSSAPGPLVDLGGQHLGQQGQVAELGALSHLGQTGGIGAHGGQVQLTGGRDDGGCGGGVGHLGHHTSRRAS